MTEEQKQAEENADKQRVERVREFDHNKLPRDKDGKVIIPMSARCESLNVAVAATIVMWQMRR